MSNTFGFIKGVGFTLALLAAYVAGFGLGERYMEKQFEEEDENNSVQDAEVEKI